MSGSTSTSTPSSSAISSGAPALRASRGWRRTLRRVLRPCLSWLDWILVAYRHGRAARDARAALLSLSPDALRDIGVPQDVLSEVEALQEFERGRSPGFIQYW